MPILTCICFTFNWLTLTCEMHFVKFHPEAAFCLLSRGKRKYAPLGMRLLWKYIRNYFLVYQLTSHFFPKLQRILSWNFGFVTRKIWAFIWYQKNVLLSGWTLGDENVIGIRSFKFKTSLKAYLLMLNRGRSQNCQNLNFLHISVALL